MNKVILLIASAILLTTNAKAQNDTTEIPDDGYSKIRIGGYGEMMASWQNYGLNRWTGSPKGNSDVNHAQISIPRFVLALDYKFNSKWILGAEIEFEAGGTGTAM